MIDFTSRWTFDNNYNLECYQCWCKGGDWVKQPATVLYISTPMNPVYNVEPYVAWLPLCEEHHMTFKESQNKWIPCGSIGI